MCKLANIYGSRPECNQSHLKNEKKKNVKFDYCKSENLYFVYCTLLIFNSLHKQNQIDLL